MPLLLAALLATGCASTRVTSSEQLVTGQLPRPGQIWVYRFVASAADLPADSTLASEQDVDTSKQSQEDIAAGQQFGALIANNLVDEINKMGLPASVAIPGMTPQVNDIVIRGYILSVKDGSAAKRVIVGFGAGASEMRTMVEGYQMTAQGLRKLGVGTVDAGGGKSPGAALGVATFLATANPAGLIISTGAKAYGEVSGSSKVEGRAKATAKEIGEALKKRFEEQGWIAK